MAWPEYVTTDTLAVMDIAVRPKTARQVAEAILAGHDNQNLFYRTYRINGTGIADIRLVRRVKYILRTYASYPIGNERLRAVGRVSDRITYANA